MTLDPDRVLSAAAAALASVVTSLVGMVAVWFGVPPPTMRQVWRTAVEAVVGVPLACVFGYGFGKPVAGLMTALVGWLVRDSIVVDPLAGAMVVGAMVLKVVPMAGMIADARLRKALARQRTAREDEA